MIIKSLEMSYFFRMYKPEKIDFIFDDEKNVTVIKGDNGTGKTTMLSAFSWAFYGVVEMPLVVDEMLNKHRLQEMKLGEKEKASVTVVIENEGKKFQLQRSQQFVKVNEHYAKIDGLPILKVIDMNKPGDEINDEKFFDRIIPKDLSGFFFFDGERIDRLAQIDGREEIAKAILDVLGLTTLSNLDDVLAKLAQQYNKDSKKHSKDTQVQEVSDLYDDCVKDIENLKDLMKKRDDERKKADAIVKQCDSFLANHNADTIKKTQDEREILTNDNNRIEDTLIPSLNSDIAKYISHNFKYALILPYFPKIAAILEDKRRKRELPSDIKAQFIKDLLADHHCICGRPLEEHTEWYERLVTLSKTAGRDELDNAYITMSAFINSEENRNKANDFFSEILKFKKEKNDLENRRDLNNERLKEISKELSTDFGDLIAKKEGLRQEAAAKFEEAKLYYEIAKHDLKKREEEREKLESKIKLLKAKGQNKNMFQDAFELATDLKNLNAENRAFFINVTREDMNKKIKEVFSLFARKDDREPELTENFELIIRNKQSKNSQILSQGERQITSLSFIGALVSYSREKAKGRLITDFSGGDFPIVMDSPFGNLDGPHREHIAKVLPKLATQVVVIVSEEQWKGTVSENMKEKVKCLYEMSDGEHTGKDDEFTELRRTK